MHACRYSARDVCTSLSSGVVGVHVDFVVITAPFLGFSLFFPRPLFVGSFVVSIVFRRYASQLCTGR